MSLRKGPGQRAALLIALGSSVIVGCMLVAPLDDLPAGSAGKSQAGSSHGGADQGGSAQGGSPAGGEGAASPSDGGQSPSGGQCKTNAECVSRNADEPARCRTSDHTCVTLRSDICPVVLGNASTDPNAIVFGGFAPINRNAPDKDPIVFAHQLALQELSGENVGGLPDGPGGVRRPLVMVICSNAAADVAPALDHLIDEVEVPAVIATLQPVDLRRGFEAHQATKDVFYLSPIAVTQPLVIERDHDLIWNLLGEPSDVAPTYTALLNRYEKFVRGVRGLASDESIRVTLVTTDDAFNQELGDAIEPLLNFNNQGTAANAAAGNYSAFTLKNDDPQLAMVATQIVETRPDIIISTANELLTAPSGLLQRIEMEWGDNALKGTPEQRKNRPFYLLSPYNAGDLGAIGKLITDFIEGNQLEANRRFIGVSIAGAEDTSLQRAYEGRLRKLVKTPNVDTANYYDATYFLAYAMYGSGEQQPTGPGIARGMQRLLSGESFNVGPGAVSEVFNALATPTATVTVESTLGPPSFDPKTGVRPVSGSVYCFDKAGEPVSDVLRYDATKKDVVGQSFPCFSGLYP